MSLGLWTTSILLDEILLIFETGVEATHSRLLIAELLTLILLRFSRPSGHAEGPSPPPD